MLASAAAVDSPEMLKLRSIIMNEEEEEEERCRACAVGGDETGTLL